MSAKSEIRNQKSEVLSLILARAGSKGLPGKNSRLLLGKPLVAYSIEHAQQSAGVDVVALSTDGADLAAIGRAMGVEVVDRPTELASDTATVDSAARQAVEVLEARRAQCFDIVVILYGNIPVRPRDLTERAVAKLRDSGADSVQSVYPVGKNHPYWMKTLGGAAGDTLQMYEPNSVYRRQDLPAVYMLDGGIIAVTRASLFTVTPGQPHAFLGQDRRAIVTQPGEVIDIDDELDFTMAEAVVSRSRQPSALSPQPAD